MLSTAKLWLKQASFGDSNLGQLWTTPYEQVPTLVGRVIYGPTHQVATTRYLRAKLPSARWGGGPSNIELGYRIPFNKGVQEEVFYP